MAKTGGLGDNFYVGGYDLSGDVNAISKIASPRDVFDFTGVKFSAPVRQVGLKQGEMDFTTFFDFRLAVTTPGVPSSGTPVVSTYNDPVLVTVIGGTGTQVNINGVNQGSFDGTYVLPSLGTITLTYSVAPTWSWVKIGGSHDALSTLPRTDQIVTWCRGTTIGNPAACVNAKQINYDGTRDNVGNFTLAVQAMGNSFGLEWGKQLTAGLRTDTTATVGAFFDDGGSSAFGGQAYFQLVEFVGTSVTIDIQSATTSGGSYATTGLTTTAMTAVGSQRLATSNTTTINEFLKVITTGTFTYAVFNVVFVRNAYAGLVF